MQMELNTQALHFLMRKKKPEAFLKLCDKHLILYPYDFFSYQLKGTALVQLGKYEEAVTFYDLSLQIQPINFIALLKKSQALTLLRRYDESIETSKIALQVPHMDMSSYAHSYYQIGICLYYKGEYKEAMVYLDQTIEANPQLRESYHFNSLYFHYYLLYKLYIFCTNITVMGFEAIF